MRFEASDHLDAELADLLAQGVAIEAEQLRRADLVAARRRQRNRHQRPLHFADDAVIESRWRQPFAIFGEMRREVALFNVKGEFRAVDNRCLHEGGPFCRGSVVNWTVTCPRHHWHYDLRTGEAIGRPGRRLRCYPVEVQGDQVYVRMPRRGALNGIQELLRGLAHVG